MGDKIASERASTCCDLIMTSRKRFRLTAALASRSCDVVLWRASALISHSTLGSRAGVVEPLLDGGKPQKPPFELPIHSGLIFIFQEKGLAAAFRGNDEGVLDASHVVLRISRREHTGLSVTDARCSLSVMSINVA
jgi:hypothetical protein